MSTLQPPPTYTLPVIVDPQTREASFNPIWLNWFVELAQTLNDAGGTTLDHNSLGGLQGGAAGEYYHLDLAQYNAIGALGALGANRIVYSNASGALATEAEFGYNESTNLATIPNLSVTGNSIWGDAAADTITYNAANWTLTNNVTLTRTVGAAAAGSSAIETKNLSWSGDAGGTSSVASEIVNVTISGSNNLGICFGPRIIMSYTGTGTMAEFRTQGNFASVTSTGSVTTLRGYYGQLQWSSSGGSTTGVVFEAGVPSLTGTGGPTTLYGYWGRNMGNATLVPTAITFQADNSTICSALTVSFRSQQNSGLNAWGFLHSGTSNNAFNGPTRFGSNVAPTVTVDITGSARISGTLGVTGLTSVVALTATSTITLSGTAANIATGSNFISNGGTDAGLSFNASNNATFSGSITSSVLTANRLPLVGTAGLITDSATFTYADGSASKSISLSGSATISASLSCTNTDSAGAAAIAAAATGTGDAYIALTVSGISTWFAGVDNSASDRFAFSNVALGSSDVMALTTSGSVILNASGSALSTSATNGFTYVPSCAGTPTGAPTAVTGAIPIVVDSTNNKLYFYSGGAWRDAGP